MNPLSKREKWYLCLVLLLLIGFFAQNLAAQVTFKEYKIALNKAIYDCNTQLDGKDVGWNYNLNLSNISIKP
jgi:hypothetical protein